MHSASADIGRVALSTSRATWRNVCGRSAPPLSCYALHQVFRPSSRNPPLQRICFHLSSQSEGRNEFAEYQGPSAPRVRGKRVPGQSKQEVSCNRTGNPSSALRDDRQKEGQTMKFRIS